MLQWLMMFIHLVFFRFGTVFVYLLTAVVGIILSKRSGKADSVRISGACLLLVLAYVAEYFLPMLMVNNLNHTFYFIVHFGCYMIRYVAMFIALKIFCGYKLTRWVAFLLIVSVVVCFFYCLFRTRMIFGLGSFVNGIDKGTTFLMAFFNNQSALNSVSLLLTLVPPVCLCIDGFLTIKKND